MRRKPNDQSYKPKLIAIPLLMNITGLEVLRALVGHIPPNPLWAELIWQRQDELKKQAAASQPSHPAVPARSSQDALSRSQQI